jgi:polyhydroxybutyrate depolymerase
MRKFAGLAVAVVVVLGVAVLALLHGGGTSGKATAGSTSSRGATGSPGTTTSPSATHSAKIVKVATSIKTYFITVSGLKRSYEVIAPVSGLPKSAPVIFMLSGYGATTSSEITRDKLVPYASSKQAEIVYPVPVQKSWNAVDCCGYAHTNNVDDMAFLKALVSAVDPGHARPAYIVGYSNGARLAYRVACTDPGLFDAYAAVKGGPSPGCMANKPLTIVHLASLDDPESAYNPGSETSKDPIAVTTLVARLRETDQCPAKPVVTHSGSVTVDTWSGCAGGTRLALATWTDGVHSFPRPPASVPAAAQVIWSFFTNTPLAPLP